MANSLSLSIPVSIDGYSTAQFESDWYGVTLLTAAEPLLDTSLLLFNNGIATDYFESLWNGAAVDLGKEALDTNVILENDGLATPEFEALWEDLIT